MIATPQIWIPLPSLWMPPINWAMTKLRRKASGKGCRKANGKAQDTTCCGCPLSASVGTTYAISGYSDGFFALGSCSGSAQMPAPGSTVWDGSFTRATDPNGIVQIWEAFTDPPGTAGGGFTHMTGRRMFTTVTTGSAFLNHIIEYQVPTVELSSPVAACWYMRLSWYTGIGAGCVAWRGYKVGGDTPAGNYTYISGANSSITTVTVV